MSGLSGKWHRRWSIYLRKPAIFRGRSTNVCVLEAPDGVAVRESTDHRLPAVTPSVAAAPADPAEFRGRSTNVCPSEASPRRARRQSAHYAALPSGGVLRGGGRGGVRREAREADQGVGPGILGRGEGRRRAAD